MRKHLLLLTLVLIGQLVMPSVGKAAVQPVSGCVDPEVSTDVAPKWYTIMSSHISAVDRQNRFLVWDGSRLKTEKFDSGIPEDQLESRYLWRLERGDGDNKVYIVNKSGLRIYAPAGVNPTNNTALSVNESGVEWEMKLASETGQSDCAEKQYCFNYLGAESLPAYLNAMDSQNNDVDKAYGITVYNAGVHQASGWFFYEANVPEEVKYTVNFEVTPIENGSLILKQGDDVIQNGDEVEDGTELQGILVYEDGFKVKVITVNGTDYLNNIVDDTFTFTVTENINIYVEFESKPTGLVDNPLTNAIIPGTFKENLKISKVNPGDNISLYSITGQLISSKTARDSWVTLDTADISNGCYIVQIKQAGNFITRKTIKR